MVLVISLEPAALELIGAKHQTEYRSMEYGLISALVARAVLTSRISVFRKRIDHWPFSILFL